MTGSPAFEALDEWLADAPRLAISAHSYNSIRRRVADWAVRPYVSDAQRQELAELILRGGRDAD